MLIGRSFHIERGLRPHWEKEKNREKRMLLKGRRGSYKNWPRVQKDEERLVCKGRRAPLEMNVNEGESARITRSCEQ